MLIKCIVCESHGSSIPRRGGGQHPSSSHSSKSCSSSGSGNSLACPLLQPPPTRAAAPYTRGSVKPQAANIRLQQHRDPARSSSLTLSYGCSNMYCCQHGPGPDQSCHKLFNAMDDVQPLPMELSSSTTTAAAGQQQQHALVLRESS